MSSRAQLILIAFAFFLAGVFADQLLMRAWIRGTSPPPAAPVVVFSSIPAPLPAVASAPSLAPKAPPSVPVVVRVPDKITVEKPKNFNPAAELALNREFTERVDSLMESPLPELLRPIETRNDDGSLDRTGKTADGKSAYQHFNPRGVLTREGWSGDGGETMGRTFYENGGLKQFYWSTPYGSSTRLFNESGQYETAVETDEKGVMISTQFDDLGQVKEVWKLDQNRDPERIQ